MGGLCHGFTHPGHAALTVRGFTEPTRNNQDKLRQYRRDGLKTRVSQKLKILLLLLLLHEVADAGK